MQSKYQEQIFNDGVDESAESVVAMGGVDLIQNGYFRREGGVHRRNGFSSPTSPTVGTGATDAAHTLVANGATAHVLRKLDAVPLTNAIVSGVSATNSNKPFVLPGTVSSLCTLRDGRGFKNANVAVTTLSSGLEVACVVGQLAIGSGTTETSDAWVATVVETATGVVLQTVTVDGRRPRPVWRGDVCCIPYLVYDSGAAKWNIGIELWNSAGTGLFTSQTVTLSTAVAGDYALSDIAVWPSSTVSTQYWVAWVQYTAPNDIYIALMGSGSGTAAASTNFAREAGTNVLGMCQGIQDPTLLHIVQGSTTAPQTDVKICSILGSLSGSPTSTTTVITGSGTTPWAHLVIADCGTTGRTLVVAGCAYVAASTPHLADTKYAKVTYNMGATLPSSFTPSLGKTLEYTFLLGHPLMLYPDDVTGNTQATPCLLLSRVSDDIYSLASRISIANSYVLALPFGANHSLSSTYPGYLSAISLSGGACNGADNINYLVHSPTFINKTGADTSPYTWAELELEEVGSTASSVYGVRVMRLATDTLPATTKPLPRAQLGNLTYLGGNLLRYYDGSQLGEAVPMFPPLTPTFAQTTGGSLTTTSTYGYAFVWVWEDRKGNAHRSAPSSHSITLTGANNKVTLDWSANNVFPTSLNPGGTPNGVWRVEVYRTAANGSTYQLEQSSPHTERTALSLVSIAADADIASNKVLYTTGNVLANECPPTISALTSVGNRLFGINAVDPRSIVFSKELEEGFSAEFNPVLGLRLEASESEPVALAGLGSLLVMFTKREAWAVSTHGGPDATGSGTFGIPERLAPDCGASSAEAAVSIPLGVLVHDSSGFRLLTGNGAIDVPVVSDTAPGTLSVRRSLHIPEREEVWFLMRGDSSTNRVLVFSYARNQLRWMTWLVGHPTSTPKIYDIVSVDGTPYALVWLTNGHYEVMKYDTGTYVDGGSVAIDMTIRTRWFKPGGQLGDVRFWLMHVFGTAGTSALTAKYYAMDVDGSPDDDLGETFLRGTYDWSNAVLSNDTRILHVRERLTTQKASAVKVQLTTTGGPSNSAGPILHAIGWDYGMRSPNGVQRGSAYEGS